MRQSRIAATNGSGTRNTRGLTGNAGRSRAARCFRIVTHSIASDKEFTLFCTSWIWVNNWLTAVGFLTCCIDNSSIFNCLARSVSSQQILLNSSMSWQSFARFARKSQFLISHPPHKLIFSLWAWSYQWFACCSCNRWDSNSWLISWRAISEFLFSQCLTSTSASAPNNLCWANFSPRTANSDFRSRNLWRFCLSLSVCTTIKSRSLFSLDTDSKTLGTTVSWSTSAASCLELVLNASLSSWKLLFQVGRLIGDRPLLTLMQNLGS